MKSKIMLLSIPAMLVAMGSANATTFRPFVGATMGLQGIMYSDGTKDDERNLDYDLPESLFTYGFEGGFRFGDHSKIYNGGVSLNLDMSTEADIDAKFSDIKKAELTTNTISATYDNYIRISGDKASRIDLVLGAGFGSTSARIEDSNDPIIKSGTEHSGVFALKAGLDFELSEHFTLSAMSRLFIPTKSDYAADASYIVGGAVKYIF